MEIAEVIDYAHPIMQAERALKDVHDAALRKDWCSARENALAVIKWMAETHSALSHMESRDKR